MSKNRSRSDVIQQIKKINPSFKSRRTDTYEALAKVYRESLPKQPFLDELNSIDLSNFLQNPQDGAEIQVSAKAFARSIDKMSLSGDFYLVMRFEYSTADSNNEEYRVVSNFEEIKNILNKLGKIDLEEFENSFGSDTMLIYEAIRYGANIELKWYSIESYKSVHSGAYFKYFNQTTFDLSRYQIFNESDDSTKADEINCLIYSLMMSEKVSKTDLENLKLSMFHKEVKARDLKKIAIKLDITIKLRYDPKQSCSVFNKGCSEEVSIGLIDNHYFLNETTNITKMAIDKYDDVKYDVKFPSIQPKKCPQKYLTSYQVIHHMISNYSEKMFKPITLNNIKNKQSVEKLIDYSELREPKQLCKCENRCVLNCSENEFKDYSYLSKKKPFKGFYKKNDPNDEYEIWFIDTETFIQKSLKYHVAFCLCAIRYNEKTGGFKQFEFFGLDCVEKFLKTLKKNAIIYAHNMAFDFRVFIDHLYDLDTPMETGTKLKQVQGKYKIGMYRDKKGQLKRRYINLLFKDSYSFLPEKLSALPKMLELPCGDKDVFPYTLINEENFDKCIPLSECRKHVKGGLRKAFTQNATKIGALDKETNLVDMKKYSIHYCLQDTRILAMGFMKFRKQILQVCELDIIPLVSLPQLSDDFLKSKGVYDGCYAISGIAQDFIRRCCIGGRVMTNSNKKWHIKVNKNHTLINGEKINGANAIADFDAVSLYPSAMSMMKGYVMGLPKILTKDHVESFDSFKSSFDAYYVEIEVLNHKVNRDFPLLSIKNKAGIRNFTNDIDGHRFYVDNITLEDLIEYHGIEYKVIRGYYFNEGVNNRINEVINFMFNERLRLKKEKNNLQIVYKLLMNASYGKLIQKAITSSKKFVRAEELRKYVARYHKFIKSYHKVNDELYVIKESKSSVDHFTACHIASNILSMSKRLMNSVMCLAEDNGIKLYYQDTDSIHLHESSIPLLSKLFKMKYNRELIGKNMGQFHTDFDVGDDKASNIRAVESIFLGKKCYIDKLKYSNEYLNEKYAYHIRIKGVPTQSIKDYDSDYMKTYSRLLGGEVIEFDLSEYCPLQIDSDYRARKNTKCLSRKLRF